MKIALRLTYVEQNEKRWRWRNSLHKNHHRIRHGEDDERSDGNSWNLHNFTAILTMPALSYSRLTMYAFYYRYNRRIMRVSFGFGQDPSAEPTGGPERREDVQKHVSEWKASMKKICQLNPAFRLHFRSSALFAVLFYFCFLIALSKNRFFVFAEMAATRQLICRANSRLTHADTW